MNADLILRDRAIDAVKQAINALGMWLPPAGREAVVNAVLVLIDTHTPADQPLIDRLLEAATRDEAAGAQSKTGGITESATAAAFRLAARGAGESHDADLDASQRRAVAFAERIDAARAWARRHLDAEQQAGLLGVLRGDGERPALS